MGIFLSGYCLCARPSVEALFGRHRVGFVYQPINLEGEVVTRRDWLIDGLVFPEGTPVDTRYSFPFWRVSYGYDVLSDPEAELELGASLQLRDVTIYAAFVLDPDGYRLEAVFHEEVTQPFQTPT